MKKLLAGIFCYVLVTAHGFATYSYTLNIASGYNLIADNLVYNGNDLNDIMPVSGNAALAGCFLFKYDNSGGAWVCSYNYGGTTGWWPNFTLNPGEGAFLANLGSAFSLTFSGAEWPTPPTPITTPDGLYSGEDYDGTYELGPSSGPSPAYNYGDIVENSSAVPATNTKWLNWETATMSYKTDKYAGVAWTPGTPQAAVGEAVWVGVSLANTYPPLYLAAFSTTGVTSGGWPYSFTIAWPVSISGSPAYLQQSTGPGGPWMDVLSGGIPVTSPYTVSASTPGLYFRLSSTL